MMKSAPIFAVSLAVAFSATAADARDRCGSRNRDDHADRLAMRPGGLRAERRGGEGGGCGQEECAAFHVRGVLA